MQWDLSGILNQAQSEVQQSEQTKSYAHPLVYPQPGTLTVKLLYNPASGVALRKISRHGSGRVKVPCLDRMYGKQCPVCVVTEQIKAIKGIDNPGGVAPKTRGIAYAQFFNATYPVLWNERPIQAGQIILLMFPYMVYRQLSQMIAEYGANAAQLLMTNVGYCVKIIRTGNEYQTQPDLFGQYRSCNSDDEFRKLLESLPPLNEAVIPSTLTDEIVQQVKQAALEIQKAFMGPAVPGLTETDPPMNLGAPFVQTPQAAGLNQGQLSFGFLGQQVPQSGSVATPHQSGNLVDPQFPAQPQIPTQPQFSRPTTPTVPSGSGYIGSPQSGGFVAPGPGPQAGGVAQPGTPSPQTQPAAAQSSQIQSTTPQGQTSFSLPSGGGTVSPENQGLPECYGKHEEMVKTNPSKCIVCPVEIGCDNIKS